MDAVGVLRKTLVANLPVSECVLDHIEDVLYPNAGLGKHRVPFLLLSRELPVSGGPSVRVIRDHGSFIVDLFRLAHVGRVAPYYAFSPMKKFADEMRVVHVDRRSGKAVGQFRGFVDNYVDLLIRSRTGCLSS